MKHIISLTALFAILVIAPTFVQAQVVISEVYGGGGNSGSTWKNDFIELYNPTGSAVNLSGWSVQYVSATGSGTWSVTSLTGSIPSHGFYLIKEAPGAGGSVDLPARDDSGAIAMSSSNGKVALVNSTTALTGANPTDPSIIDKVGYGTTPTGYETAPTGVALTNTTSAERKAQSSSDATSLASGGADELKGNSRDTGDNSADFVTQTDITPQNSSETENPPSGNQPAAITGITRSVFIPATGTTDSVKATVTDDFGISSVKLHVRVNGGTYDSSLTMSVLSGSIYYAIIPATKHTTNGHLVEYFISAIDDSSAYSTTVGALQGYFVGDAPISSIKAQTLTVVDGYGARVNVTLNVPTNILSNGSGYVQDATGGMRIAATGMPWMLEGRNAKIEGTVDARFNAFQLTTPNFNFVDTGLGTSGITPVTITLPTTQSASSANEGKVVKIFGMTTAAAGTYAASTSYLYEEADTDTITMFIESNGSNNTIVGNTIPATPKDVVGILAFFNTFMEIKPRSQVDVGFNGGDGSGTASITPATRLQNVAAVVETLTITGDGVNTNDGVSITIPSTWAWTDTSSKAISGAGFASAVKNVTGDGSGGNPYVITISGAAVTNSNTGTIIISNLTTPSSLGLTTFITKTKGSGGALTSVASSPTVNIISSFRAVNSGNWNNTGTWSGGVVPGAGDDVMMDSLNVTVTIDNPSAVCRDLIMVGTSSIATNSGPLLQFEGAGSRQLTVNRHLSITGGSGGGGDTSRGGRPKLTSNGNSSATLIIKGNVTTTSSNSPTNTNAGLNMNEGTVKLTGASTDSLKNGATFRMGNLEIGDGSLAKTLRWSPSNQGTMYVRSLTVKTGSTFWIGSNINTNASNIGNSGTSGVPFLTGGITIDNGATINVQGFGGDTNVASINIDNGGITNNGTFDIAIGSANQPKTALHCFYNVNFGGFTGGTSGTNQTIGGSNAGHFSNITVASGDTLTLQQDVDVSEDGVVTLNGVLVENTDKTIRGTVVSTRNVQQSATENFGGIGAVVTPAADSMGTTTVTRKYVVSTSGNNSIRRYFDIVPTNNAGLNATFEFHYDNSELGGQNATTLELWKSIDAGANWTEENGTVDTTNHAITLSGINDFSRWTASDAAHPLSGATVTRDYPMNNRWNMISVPLTVLDYAKSTLYSTSTSSAYAYTGSYVSQTTLANGSGYWLKFPSAQNVSMTGDVRLLDTVDVVSGWNMVGSISDPVPTASVGTIPAMTLSSFYTYSGSYVVSSTIDPGRGYWVKASTAGQIVIVTPSTAVAKRSNPPADMVSTLNSLTITDKSGNQQTLYFGANENGKFIASNYELPPVPPLGLFDARFGSQRYAETYPVESPKTQKFPISLQATAYPVTIRWNIVDAKSSYTLTDAFGGKLVGTQSLGKDGMLTISSSKVDNLVLEINSGGNLPTEFALSSNFPNPFNPTTKFVVSMPVTAQLQVVVYDILGRKVSTLANEEKSAGYHTIEWNGLTDAGTPAVSGVYFVRMSSGSFSAVQKMMMMK